MNPSSQLVAFTLDGQSFALDLGAVHRVVRALEVTPLPNAPDIILGVINIRGELATVVDLRHRFHMPKRELRPSDQFILVNMPTASAETPLPANSAPAKNTTLPKSSTPTRNVALVVDEVTGILDVPPESLVVEDEIVANLEYVQGVAKVQEDLVLIHDLARCLSLHEERLLNDALAKMNP